MIRGCLTKMWFQMLSSWCPGGVWAVCTARTPAGKITKVIWSQNQDFVGSARGLGTANKTFVTLLIYLSFVALWFSSSCFMGNFLWPRLQARIFSYLLILNSSTSFPRSSSISKRSVLQLWFSNRGIVFK